MRLDAEANIQAEFYHACKLIGQEIALEVTTPAGRIDCALLNPARTEITAFVEVKRQANDFLQGRSKQIQRYKLLGVPIYGLAAGYDIHALAKTLQTRHQTGKAIDDIAGMTHIKSARRQERKDARISRNWIKRGAFIDSDLNLKRD